MKNSAHSPLKSMSIQIWKKNHIECVYSEKDWVRAREGGMKYGERMSDESKHKKLFYVRSCACVWHDWGGKFFLSLLWCIRDELKISSEKIFKEKVYGIAVDSKNIKKSFNDVDEGICCQNVIKNYAKVAPKYHRINQFCSTGFASVFSHRGKQKKNIPKLITNKNYLPRGTHNKNISNTMLLKRIRRQQTEQQQIFKSHWERKKSKEADADHIQEGFVWLIFQTNAWFLVNKMIYHSAGGERH